MKSLQAINHDNRMTNRDFGAMCQWFVFHEGDLVACFVHKDDAERFVNNDVYDSGAILTISEAKP